jgi:hypothetical protein
MASILYKSRAMRQGILMPAKEQGGTFPFVAIPNFEVKAYENPP